jgi:hypothetical protein
VRADVLSFIEDLNRAIESLLLDGLNVCTPSANYRVSIRGHFEGPQDSFDPERHQLVARISPGADLKTALKGPIKVSKRPAVPHGPIPLTYTDVLSDTRNQLLTPGGIGQLTGYRLKFDRQDPEQGVFFLATDGGETRAQHFVENRPRRLVFAVPELPPGQYRLEVRAYPRNSSKLNSNPLEETLTVPAS